MALWVYGLDVFIGGAGLSAFRGSSLFLFQSLVYRAAFYLLPARSRTSPGRFSNTALKARRLDLVWLLHQTVALTLGGVAEAFAIAGGRG